MRILIRTQEANTEPANGFTHRVETVVRILSAGHDVRVLGLVGPCEAARPGTEAVRLVHVSGWLLGRTGSRGPARHRRQPR